MFFCPAQRNYAANQRAAYTSSAPDMLFATHINSPAAYSTIFVEETAAPGTPKRALWPQLRLASVLAARCERLPSAWTRIGPTN
jgi:hypothetical protein